MITFSFPYQVFFLISIDLMFDTPTDVVSEFFYVAQCIISDHRLLTFSFPRFFYCILFFSFRYLQPSMPTSYSLFFLPVLISLSLSPSLSPSLSLTLYIMSFPYLTMAMCMLFSFLFLSVQLYIRMSFLLLHPLVDL